MKQAVKHWLVLLIWLAALAAVMVFATGYHWWLSANSSGYRPEVDRQFLYVIAGLAVTFVIAQIGFGYIVQHFRRTFQDEEIDIVQDSHYLEIIWTVTMAVVFFLLATMGQYVWMRRHSQATPSSAARVSNIAGRRRQVKELNCSARKLSHAHYGYEH